jgi:hypothetical protein
MHSRPDVTNTRLIVVGAAGINFLAGQLLRMQVVFTEQRRVERAVAHPSYQVVNSVRSPRAAFTYLPAA